MKRSTRVAATLGIGLVALAACRRDGAADARAGAAVASVDAGAHVDGDPARGKAAIVAYGCGSCHTVPGVREATGLVGPPLVAWQRRIYIAGEVPNTPQNLVHWIVMPQSIEPGTAMPNLGVTDGDARDIAAYLYTLR